MARPKNEDWIITRGRSDHFTVDEIEMIRIGFKLQRPCRDVARELLCPIRTINAWYAKLKEGWEPGKPQTRPSSERSLVAPMQKRTVPKPNAMPWCLAKMRAGRA